MPAIAALLWNVASKALISMALRLVTGEVVEWATLKGLEVGAKHSKVTWDDEAVAKAKEVLGKTKEG